jgi:hypothetical protein
MFFLGALAILNYIERCLLLLLLMMINSNEKIERAMFYSLAWFIVDGCDCCSDRNNNNNSNTKANLVE